MHLQTAASPILYLKIFFQNCSFNKKAKLRFFPKKKNNIEEVGKSQLNGREVLIGIRKSSIRQQKWGACDCEETAKLHFNKTVKMKQSLTCERRGYYDST